MNKQERAKMGKLEFAEVSVAAKHTPGPWEYDSDEGDYGEARLIVRNNEVHPQGPFVVSVINQSRGEESKANARLIAAAPELLGAAEAALSDISGWLRDRMYSDDDAMDGLTEMENKLSAAIARAKGE
jgi:hypothetical protein